MGHELTRDLRAASLGGGLKSAFGTAAVLFVLVALLAPSATAGNVAFVIEAKNIRWSPSSITVNKGDVVTLVIFNNDSAVPHTFELTGYNKHAHLPPGADAAITFTADQAGTFQYWCAVPGHSPYDPNTKRYTGMAGDLIVRGPPPPGSPGFEVLGAAVAVALAVAVVGVLSVLRIRRKKERGRQ